MTIPGEYYLTGVHEMGCGIKLNEDNTFEFFFSYGALDRHGYGTWSLDENNRVKLNSDYKNQIPFAIIKENHEDAEGIKIVFPNYNKILLNETTIKLYNNEVEEEQVANSSGAFIFKSEKADKFVVTCLFYFDNPATLIPADAKNNYFELTANQALPLVHFDGTLFTADGESLEGKLHIFDDTKTLRFIK